MKCSPLHALAVLALAMLPSNLQGQEEWPQFRGPSGQGIADKAPKSWGIEKGLAWKVPVEAKGWSSPVISGGKVVLTGATGERENPQLEVLALDAASGRTLWSKQLFQPNNEERLALHAKNSLASGTPLIHNGKVYAHFGHMGTAALELDTGKILWSTKFPYEPKHGGASSLILADGKLVFSADGESDPMLVALHSDTGKIAWQTPRTAEAKRSFSFSTPLLTEVDGRPQIISPASGMVAGYDPKDGKAIWTAYYDEGFSVVPSPVVMNEVAFISTSFMKPQLLAIALKGARGDVSKSRLEWTVKKFAPKTPSFVAMDGVLYVLDDTGALSCIDAENGTTKWKEKLIGNFSASPILADGCLYCFTEDGVCYVLRVSPEGRELLMELDLEQRILASPAVVDGALYIRTETHLWKVTGD